MRAFAADALYLALVADLDVYGPQMCDHCVRIDNEEVPHEGLLPRRNESVSAAKGEKTVTPDSVTQRAISMFVGAIH